MAFVLLLRCAVQGWQTRIKGQLDQMAQWKHGKLMSVDSANSHIRTHFNDSLVGLLREVWARPAVPRCFGLQLILNRRRQSSRGARCCAEVLWGAGSRELHAAPWRPRRWPLGMAMAASWAEPDRQRDSLDRMTQTMGCCVS